MLWGNHHYDRCALKVLSGTHICRFLLFRASIVRVPAHSYSATRKYLGALRRVNPERTSSPQLIVIRWHHLEISPHTFKPASSDAISHPWKPILEAFDKGPESFRIRVTFFHEARHVVGPTLWLFRGHEFEVLYTLHDMHAFLVASTAAYRQNNLLKACH